VEDGVKEKDDELVAKRRCVDEYLDNSRTEREWAEVHRDYYDDKQWTSDEMATLRQRGQPVITDNKIKDKVEYMEGVERKTRTDPKAFPRNPVEEESADVATDCIRYVFDANRFPIAKSAVFQNLCIEGFGGCEVIVEKDDPTHVLIRKIRWDRLYRDPYSMEPDCSDATYLGVITWMDQSRALERWPGSKDKLELTSAQGSTRNSGESVDDKPRWADSKRKRVQIFEHYEKKQGKIFRSVFCWGGFLEPEAECAYVDDDGKHEWPIVVASAYIDREGRRYGLVKRYISLQDEINKRRSKSLHLLNTAFIKVEDGAVEDVNKAREQVHKPDGLVEIAQGMLFEVERNLDLSQGHFQLLQQAEMALAATGPNAALLGQSGAISGRAKQLDQQGGALQIGVLFDSIRDWQLRVAKATWNRIRQYWDSEMMIRVTDSEAGLKFVELNKPLTNGELAAKRIKGMLKQGMPQEEAQGAIQQLASHPDAQLPAVDDQYRPILDNDVSKLDVDIILDEAPDVVTLQAEEFQKLADLAGSGQVQIPPDALIEASGLRPETKKRILDIMKGTNDPAQQMMAKFQQMMQELEGMLKEAQVRKTHADADLALARAGSEHIKAATSVVEASNPPEPNEGSGQPPRKGNQVSRRVQ
jgi:hypothetical protein